MIERKFEAVEPDAPNRCQAIHGKGQCIYREMAGSRFCPMHGGNSGAQLLIEKSKRQYQLAKWQGQVDAFADEDSAKSLRGEIGITRLLLQQVMSRCKDTGELLMMSGKITDLIMKLERLVVSCDRLETKMGLSLDKGRVLDLAAQMVGVIGMHIHDDEIMSRISDDIVRLIATSSTVLKEA